MDDRDLLAERFEEHRARLRAVAYRMLGSSAEADDAVQEAWLRLNRSSADDVDNLGGWMTTVVARICLDMLRSRSSRREEPWDGDVPEPTAAPETGGDPEREALLADAVGPALLVVLETLAPDERLSFVLHDMFAVPFDEIAAIVGCSPASARQLASRARRKVQGTAPSPNADPHRQRAIVDAFLAASREGDFDALVAMLHPEVVARADRAAAEMGADPEVRGAREVAGTFAGRARAARLALVDGEPGLAWLSGDRPQVVFVFTIDDGAITAIDLVADPGRLASMTLDMIGD